MFSRGMTLSKLAVNYLAMSAWLGGCCCVYLQLVVSNVNIHQKLNLMLTAGGDFVNDS
jgi:hypothetical protein